MANADPEIQRLIEDLSTPARSSRAIERLAILGPPARDAVPALIGALSAPPPDTQMERELRGHIYSRAAMVVALVRIGRDSLRPLMELTREGDDQARWLAGMAIEALGPEAAESATFYLHSLERTTPPLWRGHAIMVLALMGDPSERVCATLEREAKHPDPDVAATAALGLAFLRPDLASAVTLLGEAMRTSKAPVQGCACRLMTRMLARASEAVEPVLKMGDVDDWYANFANWLFLETSPAPAIERLVEALRRPDLCEDAHETLKSAGPAAVDTLARLLADGELGDFAADILAGRGECSAPVLFKRAGDVDPGVRRRCIDAFSDIMERETRDLRDLAKQTPATPEAVPFLNTLRAECFDLTPALALFRDRIQDPDAEVRAHAAMALGRLESEALCALPELTTSASDPDEGVRAAAACALVRITREVGDRGPLLWRALDDASARVRRAAVEALAQVPPSSASSIEAFTRHLQDPDERVRAGVASLVRIHRVGSAGKEEILRLLRDPDVGVRAAALGAVGQVEADLERLVPLLVAGLADEVFYVRGSAVAALARLGNQASKAVPALLETSRKDDWPFVRADALAALVEIDPGNDETSSSVRAALSDTDPAVSMRAADLICSADPAAATAVYRTVLAGGNWPERLQSASALWKMGRAASPAVPSLVECLGDRDGTIRSTACRALGSIGIATPEVLEALRALENDPVESVRSLARDVLARMCGGECTT